MPRGVAIAAISANDPATHPADGPAEMVKEACDAGYCFPYLFDERQSVARAFDAQCTPDIYLFDASHRLVYRGQLDDSRPKSDVPVTGRDLRAALDAVLGGRPPLHSQTRDDRTSDDRRNEERKNEESLQSNWRLSSCRRGGRESNPQPPA